jgi:hypothetical protein
MWDRNLRSVDLFASHANLAGRADRVEGDPIPLLALWLLLPFLLLLLAGLK